MSKLNIVTDSNLSSIIGSPALLLQFSAEWCGPCRQLSPLITEIANETDGKLVVAKVDVDDNTETAIKYGIRSIPSLLFIKDGVVIDKMVGLKSKEEITNGINALLN